MNEISILYFLIACFVLMHVCLWRIFTKAGESGIMAFFPILNALILARIIKKPWWWLFQLLIPYIGIAYSIWSLNLLVKSFGKSEFFTIECLLLPFIFIPILAFGNSKYIYANEKAEEETKTQLIQSLIDHKGGEGKAILIKDKCPACGTKISFTDHTCPDCGLHLN